MVGNAVFRTEGRQPFGNDVDASHHTDAVDRLEICSMLVGHPASAENE